MEWSRQENTVLQEITFVSPFVDTLNRFCLKDKQVQLLEEW